MDVTSSGSSSYPQQSARALPVRHTLALRPGEALVQVAWQPLVDPGGGFHAGSEGAASAAAAAAAVLTSERVVVVSERLEVLASASVPPDMGVPASCLWLGPALLVTTSGGQLLQLAWDGALLHAAALLGGPPSLLGALADRVLLAARAPGSGEGVGVRACVCVCVCGWVGGRVHVCGGGRGGGRGGGLCGAPSLTRPPTHPLSRPRRGGSTRLQRPAADAGGVGLARRAACAARGRPPRARRALLAGGVVRC